MQQRQVGCNITVVEKETTNVAILGSSCALDIDEEGEFCLKNINMSITDLLAAAEFLEQQKVVKGK